MNPEERVPYATAVDFDRALTDCIADAAASSPYRVNQLRRHFAYGRLLTRLFLQQPERWVLKGATDLLARLPQQARHSIDVDLYFAGEVEGAIDALRVAHQTRWPSGPASQETPLRGCAPPGARESRCSVGQ